MVFSRPGGVFLEAIYWLNDLATSCSSRSRSSAAATTKVAAEQLTAGAGQQDGHVDKLPRAAKSWKFVFFIVFFNWGFRRDVTPRGLSLQGTIPSLSAMVFSRPGGVFLEAIYWLNDLATSCSSRSRSSTAATAQVAAEQLTAGAGQQGWKQRGSNNQSSSRAAYSRSRAAGRPCGQAATAVWTRCQELLRAGNLFFV